MSESEHTPGLCPYCGTQMVNCGAPIWEDYCPDKKCTGHADEMRQRFVGARKAFEISQRVRDASHDMLEVLRATRTILDANWDADEFNSDLVSDLWKNEIHEKITAVIAKADGKA